MALRGVARPNQVPKMEGFLYLIAGYFGVFRYISRTHTADIGEDSSILGT